ncbi:hypothetical protein H2199_008272 [Coniosporium tulheliwenetii]|uniref:Uncharacterized protein n=1 Tax=Coniosporium tulheliwenetii TaxID=3383036 RepID=A0ACC2YKM9_9PEZI|nr:hypothetical protein H2199_008272 [Cladosporium sp. JES 115]
MGHPKHLQTAPHAPSGFGALSRRSGLKPVIAAVNGLAYGGGCEIIINCDMVLASPSATFALPEVKRGVVALAGALPRLIRTVGRPRAMEMALTGRTVSAKEAESWGLINRVVEEGGVVEAAVEMAKSVAENSPDAVVRLQSPSPTSSLAIIDVRDSDHIGGHIRSSTHVPSSSLDFKIPELIRTLRDKETVVFHCALSQQRGPSAALRYGEDKSLTEAYQKDLWEYGY